MRYMTPRKFWERGALFDIYDEDRRPVCQVRDPAFSWDHHWTIQDFSQTPLAYANQEMAMSSVEYQIFREESLWISVPGSAFDSRITELDLAGPNPYVLRGNFWQLDYQFFVDGESVATVGQHRWAHANMLSLETRNDDDDYSMLLTIMTIEQILHG